MDKILDNLTDPSWWFTGLFFVILLKYSPYLFALIKERVRKVARKYFLSREYKYKCCLRDLRHNLAAVNHQSAKFHAYFLMYLRVVSCLVCCRALISNTKKKLSSFHHLYCTNLCCSGYLDETGDDS